MAGLSGNIGLITSGIQQPSPSSSGAQNTPVPKGLNGNANTVIVFS